MSDPELFELCREVEKRTRWGQYGDEGLNYFDTRPVVPLYTSDYLLEKLPAKKGQMYLGVTQDEWEDQTEPWQAGYFDNLEGESEVWTADTPLKALLKLVIALDDAGELK